MWGSVRTTSSPAASEIYLRRPFRVLTVHLLTNTRSALAAPVLLSHALIDNQGATKHADDDS